MRKWLIGLLVFAAIGAVGQEFSRYLKRNPYLDLPPGQILAQGRALTARWKESNQPHREGAEYKLIENREADDTRAALRSIANNLPEYAEAQQILVELDKQEKLGKKLMQAELDKMSADDVDGRKAFAKRLEDSFLDHGMDVTVTTGGPKATVLNFRYALVNRPFARKIANEGNFLQNRRRAGFKRVNFTDGYDTTIYFDLTEN